MVKLSQARKQHEESRKLSFNLEEGNMSTGFQWTLWLYIPEDRTHHNHRCENIKPVDQFGMVCYIKGRKTDGT
jgi:hypothetical protein